MAAHKKRERTQNWTMDEKTLLLKLCANKIHILESKKADQYSLAVKMNIWKDIHKEFQSNLHTDRDILRLKEQWQRMKKQARSELQDIKLPKVHDVPKKISNLSEEVLKTMEKAAKLNQEELYMDLDSCDDNTPTYFCETEVTQESRDEDIKNDDYMIDDLESSESSEPPKRDSIFNILASMCENPNETNNKRKVSDVEELEFLQIYLLSKHKEHQKRMAIIEEQFKIAKLQRETAEINKQIAQQELKQLLSQNFKAKAMGVNGAIKISENDENKNNMYGKLQFHQNQIQLHEDEIVKHKQQIEDMIKKEH